MPSKLDEYLNKGGYTDQDREALQGEKAQTVDQPTPPPSKIAEAPKPEAPQPILNEVSKDRIEGMKEVEGNNHEQQSESTPLTKDSLAKFDNSRNKGDDTPEIENELDQDHER